MLAAMIATIHPIRKPRAICSACGTQAGCGCNAAYMPAREYAAAAMAKDPDRSLRSVAAECGISHETVRKVRNATVNKLTVEKIRGVNGKKYRARMPEKMSSADPVQEPCDDCVTGEQQWQRSASNFLGDLLAMQAYWRREFGPWEKFKIPSTLATLAEQAAVEFPKLAKHLIRS